MQYKQDKDTYLISLDQHEPIMKTLTEFCIEKNIQNGQLSGIGAIKDIELGAYILEDKEYVKKIFPDTWEVYKSGISNEDEKNYLKAYGEKFKGTKGKRAMDKAFMNWSFWESSISKLLPESRSSIEKDLKKNKNVMSLIIARAHE